MTLKYVQDHDQYNHHKTKPVTGEVHIEDGEILLGDKPTGYTVDEELSFSARNIVLGVVATMIFYVTDHLGVNVPGHTIATTPTTESPKAEAPAEAEAQA